MVFFAVSLWLLRPWLHAAPFSGEALRKIVRRGLPYVFTTSALFVVASSDRFFLARYRDLGVVGRYNLANQLAAVLGLATTAFQMARWPYVLSIRREPEARTTYANILTAFYAVGAGLAVALSLFAREIIGIVTTPAYQDAARVVPFLAFYIVGVGVSYIASIGLWMAKQTDHLAWTAAIGAAANLGLNLLLIPRFGMIGAGVATVLSQALYIAAMFWASERCYSIPYRWHHLASITALSAGWIALGTLAEREPGPASLLPKALLLLLFPLGLVAARVVAPRQLRSAAEGIGRLARARLSKDAA